MPKVALRPCRIGRDDVSLPQGVLTICLLLVAVLTLSSAALASPNAPGNHISTPPNPGPARPAAAGTPTEWDFEGLKVRLFNLRTASRDVLQRLSEEARSQVAAMEQVIEQTGLDVEDLLAHIGSRHQGAGGPFVAAAPSADDAGEDRIDASLNSELVRWDLLRDVIRSLPLAEPLAAYEVSSPFGKRRDPFNRRWAMHQGVDFNAPLKTPIVATAPGVVVFAGWKGSYGRLVEISHGPRVVSRYAHLAQILVTKGDTVETGERIGLLGSSGRSTGPHLHYEVLFDDVHRDPMMFIEAGRAAPVLAAN